MRLLANPWTTNRRNGLLCKGKHIGIVLLSTRQSDLSAPNLKDCCDQHSAGLNSFFRTM